MQKKAAGLGFVRAGCAVFEGEIKLAERGGFEPPNGEIPLTVFETAAFDRSAISPEKCEKRVNLIYSAIAKMQARIAFFIVCRCERRQHEVYGAAGGMDPSTLFRSFDSRCRFRGTPTAFSNPGFLAPAEGLVRVPYFCPAIRFSIFFRETTPPDFAFELAPPQPLRKDIMFNFYTI